jgi:hypothetical protein
MGEQFKIIEYPGRRVGSSLTKINKTLFTSTSLITNHIKLRTDSLNNFKIYIPKRFFTQAFIKGSEAANISKFTESSTNTDLSLNP